MVHRGDHPCRDEHDNVLDIPCFFSVQRLLGFRQVVQQGFRWSTSWWPSLNLSRRENLKLPATAKDTGGNAKFQKSEWGWWSRWHRGFSSPFSSRPKWLRLFFYERIQFDRCSYASVTWQRWHFSTFAVKKRGALHSGFLHVLQLLL